MRSKYLLAVIASFMLGCLAFAQSSKVETFSFEIEDHYIEYTLNDQQKDLVKLGNIGITPDASQIKCATIRFNFLCGRNNKYKNYKAYIDYNLFTKEGRCVIMSEDRIGRDEIELYRMLKHFCSLYQAQLGQVAPKYKWWPEQPISRIGQISIKFMLLF